MDREVETRVNRLCNRYLEAESRLALLRPATLPSNRSTSRAETAVVDALGELMMARKAPMAAVVRLAYVRAMREVDKGARLMAEQQQEVAALISRLDRMLGTIEAQAVINFHQHVRQLKAGQSMRMMGALEAVSAQVESSRPMPLEQYARASVLSTIARAEAAGALAGTHSGSYDGQDNAQ